jgi:hypothetical protein
VTGRSGPSLIVFPAFAGGFGMAFWIAIPAATTTTTTPATILVFIFVAAAGA